MSPRPIEARNAARRPETSSSRIAGQRWAEIVRKSSQVRQRAPDASVKTAKRTGLRRRAGGRRAAGLAGGAGSGAGAAG